MTVLVDNHSERNTTEMARNAGQNFARNTKAMTGNSGYNSAQNTTTMTATLNKNTPGTLQKDRKC